MKIVNKLTFLRRKVLIFQKQKRKRYTGSLQYFSERTIEWYYLTFIFYWQELQMCPINLVNFVIRWYLKIDRLSWRLCTGIWEYAGGQWCRTKLWFRTVVLGCTSWNRNRARKTLSTVELMVKNSHARASGELEDRCPSAIVKRKSLVICLTLLEKQQNLGAIHWCQKAILQTCIWCANRSAKVFFPFLTINKPPKRIHVYWHKSCEQILCVFQYLV